MSDLILTDAAYSNLGTLSGSGTSPGRLLYYRQYSDATVSLGNVTTGVEIMLAGGADDHHMVTLGADAVLGGYLSIKSEDATYTMTVDTNGKDLTVGDQLYIGERGILLGRTSTISCHDWHSLNGTWTPGTSTVIFTGSLTLASGQSFYSLTAGAGAAATLSDDLTVAGTLEVTGGTFDLNDYALNVDNVIVGAGGVFSMGEGDVHVTGDWDSSAGTMAVVGEGTVYFDGTTNLAVAGPDSFCHLIIPYGGSVTLLSNVWCTRLPMLYGTLNEGAFELFYGGETNDFRFVDVDMTSSTSQYAPSSVSAAHHGVHFASCLYWNHFYDGTTVYLQATDGTNVYAPEPVVTPAPFTFASLDNFDLCFDGTTVHCAYAPETQCILYYRQGTLNSDGTVTWASDWVEASSWLLGSGRLLGMPRIFVASDGTIFFICAGMNLEEFPTGTWMMCITAGTFAGGVFTVDTTFADMGRESYAPAPGNEYQPFPGAVALSGGEMMFLYIKANPLTVSESNPAYTYSIKYNPATGYGPDVYVATYPSGSSYDMVYDTVRDEVHVTFNRFRYRLPLPGETPTWYNAIITGSDLYYIKYDNTAGTWGDPMLLDSEDAAFEPYVSPCICLEESSGDVYVLYNSFAQQKFLYRRYYAFTGEWGPPTRFVNVPFLQDNAYLYELDQFYLTCAPYAVHHEVITQFLVSEHDNNGVWTKMGFYLDTISTQGASHTYRTGRDNVYIARRGQKVL